MIILVIVVLVVLVLFLVTDDCLLNVIAPIGIIIIGACGIRLINMARVVTSGSITSGSITDGSITGGRDGSITSDKTRIICFDKLEDDAKTQLTSKSQPHVTHLPLHAEKASSFTRVISSDAGERPYELLPYVWKKTLHWGQLKLMLTEVEYLTIVLQQYKESGSTKPIVMVYAGAAPGHHIVYLRKLFPMVSFELYDPNKFAIHNQDGIRTHVQFFTDMDALYWKKEKETKYVVFCSDIRTEPATNDNVRENMAMQLGWWKILNSHLSMFKFRLPWDAGYTEYPAGDIYIQPYPGPTSTETRLIVKEDADIIRHDNKKYESQCFYHNTVNRKKKYNCSLGNLDISRDGIDNCYDCVSFVHIISEYLRVTGKAPASKIELNREIHRLIRDVQNNITFGKHSIYSQTVISLAESLDALRSCQVSDYNEPPIKWKGKSLATKENTAIAVEQAIQRARGDISPIDSKKLDAIVSKDALSASQNGTCE